MSVRLDRVRPPFEASGGGRRGLAPLGVAAAAAAVVTTIGLLDPNVSGHYPTCPWLAVTGTFCPGCGSLRAIHALAHGDPVTALARNPLAVLAIGWLALWFVVWARRTTTGRVRTTMAPAWVLYGILGVIVTYWVARNVPGWTWLSPL
ncbi:MAG TPA: DUF2752 domain-containing protein [Nocardioides sp.]|nr:DUF2752 domain-containing protein [Nocardioides sp.]